MRRAHHQSKCAYHHLREENRMNKRTIAKGMAWAVMGLSFFGIGARSVQGDASMSEDEKTPAAAAAEATCRRVVGDWVAAVNSGDAAKMTAFLKGTLTGDALTENNFQEMDAQTQAVYAQSQGVEIAPGSNFSPHFAFVKLHSRQGNHWAQAFFFLDE